MCYLIFPALTSHSCSSFCLRRYKVTKTRKRTPCLKDMVMKCRAGIASNLVPPPLPCACHIWQASFHWHMLPSCLSKPVAQWQCHAFDWIRPIWAQPSTSARGTGAELGICQLPNIWAAKPGWTLIEWRSWRPQREIREELFGFNVPFKKCSLVKLSGSYFRSSSEGFPTTADWLASWPL